MIRLAIITMLLAAVFPADGAGIQMTSGRNDNGTTDVDSRVASVTLPLAIAQTSEDGRLNRMIRESRDSEIASRYRSTNRLRDLSDNGRRRVIPILLTGRPGEGLRALGPLIGDPDFSYLAIAAVLRAGGHVQFHEETRRRLNGTPEGRLALTLNNGRLPEGAGAGDALRDARMEVLQVYFLQRDGETSPQRLVRLRVLAERTANAFRERAFSPLTPAPDPGLAVETEIALALKLSIAPYVSHPHLLMTWFDLLFMEEIR
jgi:hypothetical protein